MTDNPVRDLLESVSSPQPPTHRLSVNDLVRVGRRRQRSVALAAAGGTAVVVAGAAGLVSHGMSRSTSAKVGTSTTSPVVTTASPGPSALAPSRLRVQSRTPSGIKAAHLMANGMRVGTFAVTNCLSAGLRVVSQTQSEVVLSLTLAFVTEDSAGASDAPASPAPTCRTGSSGSSSKGMNGAEAIADLDAPLGTRKLIDNETGQVIPYTADTQTAYAGWVPDGWHDVTGVRPTDLRTWEQDWSTSDNALLSLRQTFDATDEVGGAANGQVNGHPARVVASSHGVMVTWWAGGRLYNLTASHAATCTVTVDGSPCSPSVEAPTPPMTQADLLKVADSVTARR